MPVSVSELDGGPVHYSQRLDIEGRALELNDTIGRIDFLNLRRELEECGALCTYYGSMSARARRLADASRLKVKREEAQANLRARSALKTIGSSVTEGLVEATVRLDQHVIDAQDAHLEAEEAAAILENYKFAIARKQSTCEALVPMLMAEEAARREGRGPEPGRVQRTPIGGRPYGQG